MSTAATTAAPALKDSLREALGAIITYAFTGTDQHRPAQTSTDLRRIEALVNGANEPSQALLPALGFTLDGTLR